MEYSCMIPVGMNRQQQMHSASAPVPNMFPRSASEAIFDSSAKFRQLPCRTFISVGTCPYRERCVYLHDPRCICREAKTKTRRKNKEDTILDTLFWPIMPYPVVASKLDTNRQPHVIQSYNVPPPQHDQFHRHDLAVYSIWMHFVDCCLAISECSDRLYPADMSPCFSAPDLPINSYTKLSRLPIFRLLSSGKHLGCYETPVEEILQAFSTGGLSVPMDDQEIALLTARTTSTYLQSAHTLSADAMVGVYEVSSHGHSARSGHVHGNGTNGNGMNHTMMMASMRGGGMGSEYHPQVVNMTMTTPENNKYRTNTTNNTSNTATNSMMKPSPNTITHHTLFSPYHTTNTNTTNNNNNMMRYNTNSNSNSNSNPVVEVNIKTFPTLQSSSTTHTTNSNNTSNSIDQEDHHHSHSNYSNHSDLLLSLDHPTHANHYNSNSQYSTTNKHNLELDLLRTSPDSPSTLWQQRKKMIFGSSVSLSSHIVDDEDEDEDDMLLSQCQLPTSAATVISTANIIRTTPTMTTSSTITGRYF